MYNNESSPIVIISPTAAKKVFDTPQNFKNKEEAIKKAKKDLRKAGFRI